MTLIAIFVTSSKPGCGPALGVDAIREAAQIGIAVIALGGVTAGLARLCLDAGAVGVAVNKLLALSRHQYGGRSLRALRRECRGTATADGLPTTTLRGDPAAGRFFAGLFLPAGAPLPGFVRYAAAVPGDDPTVIDNPLVDEVTVTTATIASAAGC